MEVGGRFSESEGVGDGCRRWGRGREKEWEGERWEWERWVEGNRKRAGGGILQIFFVFSFR